MNDFPFGHESITSQDENDCVIHKQHFNDEYVYLAEICLTTFKSKLILDEIKEFQKNPNSKQAKIKLSKIISSTLRRFYVKKLNLPTS